MVGTKLPVAIPVNPSPENKLFIKLKNQDQSVTLLLISLTSSNAIGSKPALTFPQVPSLHITWEVNSNNSYLSLLTLLEGVTNEVTNFPTLEIFKKR